MTLSNQSYASCSAMGVMSGLPSYDTKTTPGSKQWTLCGWPLGITMKLPATNVSRVRSWPGTWKTGPVSTSNLPESAKSEN